MGYVTSILTSLPFGNIIGGPMKAAIEAQALAARATVDFIREVGFTPANDNGQLVDNNMFALETIGGKKRVTPETSFGEIRTVTFSYKTQSEQNPVPATSGGTTTTTSANADR